MAYGSISLEKRLKDNIKNYSLSSLIDTGRMRDQLEILHKLSGVEEELKARCTLNQSYIAKELANRR